MTDDLPALLLALARENAKLQDQLAAAQNKLVEAAIDAGNLHARIEAVLAERDAWRAEALAAHGQPGIQSQPQICRLGSVGSLR